jgi:hypothetical protein
LEALEGRTLPSTFYAATASQLIADIKAANLQGRANTIVLTAPTTSPYVLTARDNVTNLSSNMLPVIAPGDALTIQTGNGSANPGYGDTIDASKAGRLFDVAKGALLTLENVTLQNGVAQGYLFLGTEEGGAILNQGALVLSHVLVQNNTAQGAIGDGQSAAGGGVWSNGSLTVENSSVFANNSAQGSNQNYTGSQNGGSAYGGGICIAGGTANVTNTFFGAFIRGGSGYAGLQGNSAFGGTGGAGTRNGSAYGGAVYVASGTVTMNADTIGNPPFDPVTGAYTGAKANFASGPGGVFGRGYGGGAYMAGGTVTLANDKIIYNTAYIGGGVDIASGAKVYLDSFTKTNTYLNAGINIYGTYTLFAPQIGALAASANSVTDGASLTLTASNITDANPAATTTQVAFYVQINGTNTLLGYGTQATAGVWSFTFTVNLAPGTYTLVAQA